MTSASSNQSASSPPRLAPLIGAAISQLQSRLLADDPSARARAAELRRGAGQPPASAPQAWSIVTEDLVREFPARWLGSDAASAQEAAAYTAFTLWALHQQSSQRPMHVHSVEVRRDIGRAAGELAKQRTLDSVKRRFDAMMLAPNETSRLNHLRSLIQLFRSADQPIALDYGLLAQDLKDLTYADSRDKVLLRWGRSFNHAHFAPSRSNA
ncbi:hypothetical protein GCM10027591_00740 [Zhihengliuella somnathii]